MTNECSLKEGFIETQVEKFQPDHPISHMAEIFENLMEPLQKAGLIQEQVTEKSECVVNNNRNRIRIEMRNWDTKDLDEILKDCLNEIRSKPGNRRDKDRILLGTITSNIKIRRGIFTRIDPIEVSEAGEGSLSIPSGAVIELIEFEPHEQIEKLGQLIILREKNENEEKIIVRPLSDFDTINQNANKIICYPPDDAESRRSIKRDMASKTRFNSSYVCFFDQNCINIGNSYTLSSLKHDFDR